MALRRPLIRTGAIVLGFTLVAGGLAACAPTTSTGSADAATTVTASSLWDSTAVHDISLDIDDAAYDAIIAAYVADGTKDWATATVTIDGEVFENVGLKLKGNSTLRGVSADSDPADLPWLIRLDKYVDGQNYEGDTELVVRGNTTETSLNEALALELLDRAGLANEEAVSSRFSVNGGDAALRLVIQNPDDAWVSQNFDGDSLLYKAESDGDYSYRGDDAAAYEDVFDQEAGDENLEPLTTFLKFINESDDATFASDLDQYLDVDSFATYLAFQELIDNYDDISGPGNNSYLQYSESTGLMTVVSWDLNLAWGARAGAANGAGAAGVGGATEGGGGGGGARPGGAPGGGAGGGGSNSSNILADRFLADADFAALYDTALTDLTASLFTSGDATEVLDQWADVLGEQASDLVDSDTIAAEAEDLQAQIDAIGE